MWSKVINTFDLYGLKTINKWTTGSLINDRERLQNAIKLKKCEDFLLLDIDHFFITSSISGKSNFMGNLLFNHFHKELIEENVKRSKLVLNIKNNIENENFIDNEIIEILYLKETVLITKNKNVKFFKNIEILPISNNESLVIFFKKRNSNYLKRCLEI